jgi:hypothetical protein
VSSCRPSSRFGVETGTSYTRGVQGSRVSPPDRYSRKVQYEMSKTIDVAIGCLRCSLRFGDKTGSRKRPGGQGLGLSL